MGMWQLPCSASPPPTPASATLSWLDACALACPPSCLPAVTCKKPRVLLLKHPSRCTLHHHEPVTVVGKECKVTKDYGERKEGYLKPPKNSTHQLPGLRDVVRLLGARGWWHGFLLSRSHPPPALLLGPGSSSTFSHTHFWHRCATCARCRTCRSCTTSTQPWAAPLCCTTTTSPSKEGAPPACPPGSQTG